MNFARRLKHWDEYFQALNKSLADCIYVPGILSFDTLACMMALWKQKKRVFLGSTRDTPQGTVRMIAKAQAQPDVFVDSMILMQDEIQIEGFDSYFSLKNQDLNQLVTAIQSSGTTGEASISIHAFKHHQANAVHASENAKFNQEGVWLISLPLFHVSGLSIIMRALFVQGRICITPFKIEKILLQEPRITHVSLVATQLEEMLSNPLLCSRLKKLTAITLGGGPIPIRLLHKASELALPLIVSYGCTQMASQVSATPIAVSPREDGAGQVLLQRVVHVASDGELWIDGDCLAANLIGPIASGDLGFFDDKKNLHIIGRKDNLIISAGEKIQAEEIETALLENPDVLQVIVVAVQDKKYQQRPAAFVQMRDASMLCVKNLRNFLENRLAKYKIPDFFWAWPSFLVNNPQIKVQRYLLKTLAERMTNVS